MTDDPAPALPSLHLNLTRVVADHVTVQVTLSASGATAAEARELFEHLFLRATTITLGPDGAQATKPPGWG